MPSRSSVFSGYRPETLRNGSGPLIGKLPNGKIFQPPPGTITLPQLFRNHGYTTVSIGKVYHFNDDDPQGWSRRYTDTFTDGMNGWCSGYQLPEHRALIPNYRVKRHGPEASLPRPPMLECTDTPDDVHPDGIIARRAIEELRKFKQSGEPFFLAPGFYRPHLPWTPPKKYWDLYDRAKIQLPADFEGAKDGEFHSLTDWEEVRHFGDAPERGQVSTEKAREMIHGYHASVSFVDAQVEKVLSELHHLELDKNTIVILWGDNGWNLGDHGLWSKHTDLETCTRIALMISVPGMPKHQKSDALVELIDIYPSLCELCGLTPPSYLEGTSFVPLLQAPNRPWKSAAFSCMLDYTTLTIRTDRYRLIQRANGKNELYDHQKDPAEDFNLANDPASQEVLKKLQADLRAGWRSAKPRTPIAHRNNDD